MILANRLRKGPLSSGKFTYLAASTGGASCTAPAAAVAGTVSIAFAVRSKAVGGSNVAPVPSNNGFSVIGQNDWSRSNSNDASSSSMRLGWRAGNCAGLNPFTAGTNSGAQTVNTCIVTFGWTGGPLAPTGDLAWKDDSDLLDNRSFGGGGPTLAIIYAHTASAVPLGGNNANLDFCRFDGADVEAFRKVSQFGFLGVKIVDTTGTPSFLIDTDAMTTFTWETAYITLA